MEHIPFAIPRCEGEGARESDARGVESESESESASGRERERERELAC